MRILVDTNWYVSLLIKKNESRLHFILINPSFELIISAQLLAELTGKITEKKFRKYFSIEYGLQFVDILKLRATVMSVTSEVSICRDLKDNYLLALAKDAKADFLITGDKDLFEIQKFENTIICTLDDFLQKHFQK
jgi:putative PIN family toxin of toxin-antitoxin system